LDADPPPYGVKLARRNTKNISLIFLPSRSPELNPVENIWQYLRANWLSNRVFDTYDDIIEAACDAWNRLVDQPSTITSIGRREWAHIGQE
jgi:transposase